MRIALKNCSVYKKLFLAFSKLSNLNALQLICILFVALCLRLWGIQFGLPYRYHIDEAPYIISALKIASGDLYIEYPFNSPNIFQIVLAVEYAALYIIGHLFDVFQSPQDIANLYRSDPTVFFLLARGTNAVISTITIFLTYVLGKHLSNKRVGLLSAFFLAVMFSYARDAHYAVADTLIVFFVVSSTLCSVLYQKTVQLGYIILAGLAGGAAFGLKYLPAPILIVSLMAVVLHIQSHSRRFVVRRLSILALSVLVGFFLAFPALFISLDLFLLHLRQAFGQASVALGNFQVDDVPAWLYYLRIYVWGLGWPLFALALTGIVVLSICSGKEYVLIVVATISYYLGISVVNTYFARYGLPIVPFLAIFAAGLVVTLTQSLQRWLRNQARMMIIYALAILLVIPTIVPLLRHDYLLTNVDTRTQAKVWIENNIPEGSRIVLQWYGPPLSTVNDPEPNSTHVYDVFSLTPFMMGPNHYSLDTCIGEQIEYIVINSFNTNLRLNSDSENALRARFYQSLDQDANLLVEFRPYSERKQALAFTWEQLYGPADDLFLLDRPGPIIKVYSLTNSSR